MRQSVAGVVVALASTLLILAHLGQALDNGLARKPPMGWLAWERFTCNTNCKDEPNDCISERLFRTMADRMVTDGYRDAGYQYVNIDDCWSEMERDNSTGRLVANLERFPNGINRLSEYVRGKGLKLGLYGDCGTKTCAGYPAQLKTETNFADNHFELDAQTIADWRIDSFKFDGCYIDPLKAESICPRMSNALQAASGSDNSKPVLLICEWPFYMNLKFAKPDYELAARSCNAWRYYNDVEDSWLSVLSIVDYTIKMQDTILQHHGPGQWFDPDQLVIGNFGLSLDQAKAQMALWCIWSAPLYMSNDLRFMEPSMAAILKNEHLIEVNQDQLGVFGLRVAELDGGKLEAFVKPVEPIQNGCPSFVIAYLNRYVLGDRREVSFKLRDLLLKASSAIRMAAKRYAELYGPNKSPGDKFDPDSCLKRLATGMTKEPPHPQLLVQPVGQETTLRVEEAPVEYDVLELFKYKRLPKLALNSSLELHVNPSGVTIVHLREMSATSKPSSSISRD